MIGAIGFNSITKAYTQSIVKGVTKTTYSTYCAIAAVRFWDKDLNLIDTTGNVVRQSAGSNGSDGASGSTGSTDKITAKASSTWTSSPDARLYYMPNVFLSSYNRATFGDSGESGYSNYWLTAKSSPSISAWFKAGYYPQTLRRITFIAKGVKTDRGCSGFTLAILDENLNTLYTKQCDFGIVTADTTYTIDLPSSLWTPSSYFVMESPSDNQSVSATIPLSGYSLDIDGVNRVEAYCDGTYIGNCSLGIQREDVYNAYPNYNNHYAGFLGWLNTGNLTLGQHTLKLKQVCNSGVHTIELARKINVVNSLPYISNVSPNPNPVVSGSIRISFSITDPDGNLMSYNLWHSGSSFNIIVNNVSSGNYYVDMPISYMFAGVNTFYISVTDSRGGNGVYTGKFTFNSYAPVVSNIVATPSTTINSPVRITASITDQNLESISHRVSISNDGSTYSYLYPTNGTWATGGAVDVTIALNKFGVLRNGLYSVKIEGKDTKNNIGTGYIDVTFNNQTPIFSLQTIYPYTIDSNYNTVTVKNNITIAGTITDPNDDSVNYRVLVNGAVVSGYDWLPSDIATGSTVIITIPLSILSEFIINTVSIELRDSRGVVGTAWNNQGRGIIVANTAPLLTGLQTFDDYGVERYAVTNQKLTLKGSILDAETDLVDYRVSNITNMQVFKEYTGFASVQASVFMDILTTQLNEGANSIKIEVKDNAFRFRERIIKIIRKTYDSTYIENNINYKDSEILKVKSNGTKSYIKLPTLNRNAGYIDSMSIFFNVTSIVGGGQVVIAPILNNWDSYDIDFNIQSTIPTYMDTLTKSVSLTVGINTIDVTEMMQYISDKAISCFGYAIYTEDSNVDVSIDVINLGYSYNYYDSELKQPLTVLSNRVELEWLPIKSNLILDHTRTTIIRSLNDSFVPYEEMYSTNDSKATKFIDATINQDSSYYYYKIAIEYGGNPRYTGKTKIEIPSSRPGYKREWNQWTEQYSNEILIEGIAFDDVLIDHTGNIREIDHDFYTTAGNFRIKAMRLGNVVGGVDSPIMPLLIENLCISDDYIVTLKILYANKEVANLNGSATLNDANRDIDKSKVKMSLTENPFIEQYPLQFELNHGETKVLYFRMKGSTIYIEDGSFQLSMTAIKKI